MKSFLHDSSAFDDEKVYELYIEHDYKGVGIFYVILEKLALQEKPIKEKVLKRQLNLSRREDCIIDFMVEIGLLIREDDEISNENMMNYIEDYVSKRKKNKERMRDSRDNQVVTKNVLAHTKDSVSSNTNTNTKTKSNTKDEFDRFWDLYNKKVGKPKAIVEWNKLKQTDIENIFKVVPAYIKEREARFRKDPERFLRNRVWEDEVIFESNDSKQNQTKISSTRNNEIIIPEDF